MFKVKRNFWAQDNGGHKKYNNQKVTFDGMDFDSKLELALYHLLCLRAKAGEIRNLKHHPGTIFLTEARIQSRPDFNFENCATGAVEYAEAKGYHDQKWPLKKKLWRCYGPGTLFIYKGVAGRVSLIETIIPKRGGEDE